jgi:hypothetical protein
MGLERCNGSVESYTCFPVGVHRAEIRWRRPRAAALLICSTRFAGFFSRMCVVSAGSQFPFHPRPPGPGSRQSVVHRHDRRARAADIEVSAQHVPVFAVVWSRLVCCCHTALRGLTQSDRLTFDSPLTSVYRVDWDMLITRHDPRQYDVTCLSALAPEDWAGETVFCLLHCLALSWDRVALFARHPYLRHCCCDVVTLTHLPLRTHLTFQLRLATS